MLETKVRLPNKEKILRKFGSNWKWHCNYDFSPKGRMWLGWNSLIFDVDVLYVHEQAIHAQISDINKTLQFKASFVYGLHTVETATSQCYW